LQVRLTDGEHARIVGRKTLNLDAWLLYGQGNHEGFKLTQESMARARQLFEESHKKDPNWSRPLGGLSWTYWYAARMGWTKDPDRWMRKSHELAEKAVNLAPDEPDGYQMLSMLALSKRDYDQAIAYRKKALACAPNDWIVLAGLGGILYKAGEPERAIDIMKKALRLNPRKAVWTMWSIADAQVVAGHYEEVIQTSNEAASLQPDSMYPHIFLAAAYSALGRHEEARVEAARLLKINPNFNVSAWVKSRLLKDPADTERYASLLLKAGLPENTK